MEPGGSQSQKGEQLAQHGGGTHLLNPEPSANFTGPFSLTGYRCRGQRPHLGEQVDPPSKV